jgi:hypothetical protein
MRSSRSPTGPRGFIDLGFGFIPPGGLEVFDPFKAPAVGPCARGEASFGATFRQASVASGEGDYVHPGTMVWFVFEGIDDVHAAAMARPTMTCWWNGDRRTFAKRPSPTSPIAGPTGLYASRKGADKVRDILINECRPRKP